MVDLDTADAYGREQFLQYVHMQASKLAFDLSDTIIKEYDERHKK